MQVSKCKCIIKQYANKLYNGSVCMKVVPTGITDYKIDLEVSLNRFDKEMKSLLRKLIDKLSESGKGEIIYMGVSD